MRPQQAPPYVQEEPEPPAPDNRGGRSRVIIPIIIVIIVAVIAGVIALFVFNGGKTDAASGDAASVTEETESAGSEEPEDTEDTEEETASSDAFAADTDASADAASAANAEIADETDAASDTDADNADDTDTAVDAADGTVSSGVVYSGSITSGGVTIIAEYSDNTLTITYNNTSSEPVTLGSESTFDIPFDTDTNHYSASPTSVEIAAGESHSNTLTNSLFQSTPATVTIYGIYTSDMNTTASDGLTAAITLTVVNKSASDDTTQ